MASLKEAGSGFLVLVVTVAVVSGVMAHAGQAWAGQARAQLKVGIRIDPALVERDLESLRKGKAVEATRLSARAATDVRGAAPRVLPLAGGGVCVRQYVSATRFRWICR